MILSSRDAWRRGGSAPAWPRLYRTRSNKEETRSDISVVGRAVTCMPKVHESVHLWTFGQVCVLSFLCVLNESKGCHRTSCHCHGHGFLTVCIRTYVFNVRAHM